MKTAKSATLRDVLSVQLTIQEITNMTIWLFFGTHLQTKQKMSSVPVYLNVQSILLITHMARVKFAIPPAGNARMKAPLVLPVLLTPILMMMPVKPAVVPLMNSLMKMDLAILVTAIVKHVSCTALSVPIVLPQEKL